MRAVAYVLALSLALCPAIAEAHDWFTGKKTANGQSCCNGLDCTEIEDKDWWQKDGAIFVRWSNGVIYAMPAGEAQPSESKEGKAAACVYNGRLRCFFLPVAY